MTETARTYGEALYELARDEGLGQELLDQLQMTVDLLRENPDYVRLLMLPSLPKQERCQALDEALRDRVHPYLLNFLKILVENGTVRQLNGCEEAYRRRFYQENGILEVTAITAVPLEPDARQRLLTRLEEKTGKRVILHDRVDESILGGVRLELDGRRIDGTVRGRLDELQERLQTLVL